MFHHIYFGEAQASAAGLDNVIQIGDLSKSLSLPGLRTGWLIDADAERRRRAVDARGYFTISSALLMERFATIGLRCANDLLARVNAVARANLQSLEQFMTEQEAHLGWVRPRGGTLAFAWLKNDADARPLCEAFAKAGVLVAPGDCYGMPSYLRIGIGACEPEDFVEALRIMADVIARVR